MIMFSIEHENDINIIKEERKKTQQEIQNKINQSNSYWEQFLIIYRIIEKSQRLYLEYNGNFFFSLNKLEELKKKFHELGDMDDIIFIEFIYNELILPINSGHLKLRFGEIIYERIFSLYSAIYNNQTDLECQEFLDSYDISRLISEVKKIKDDEDLESLCDKLPLSIQKKVLLMKI